MKLNGKVAIVTGAGGPNMGRATAKLFAAEGARVCVADNNENGGLQTAAEITEAGGEAFFCRVDLLHASTVAGMVTETIHRYGAVHILANFAALVEPRGTVDQTEDEWDRVLGVTLKGTWLSCKYVMLAMADNPAPARHDNRGAILNVGSTISHRGCCGDVAYAAAKAGVLGVTRAAACDGAPLKIRVNCISPGITRTPLTPMPTPEIEAQMAQLGLLPYVGEPEDMAAAALWLCSNDARFITGAIVNVDGGWTAKL